MVSEGEGWEGAWIYCTSQNKPLQCHHYSCWELCPCGRGKLRHRMLRLACISVPVSSRTAEEKELLAKCSLVKLPVFCSWVHPWVRHSFCPSSPMSQESRVALLSGLCTRAVYSQVSKTKPVCHKVCCPKTASGPLGSCPFTQDTCWKKSAPFC